MTSPGPDIKINGDTYPTIIDEHGTQRFPKNRIVEDLLKETNHGNAGRYLDLNEIWQRSRGVSGYTADEIKEFYRLIGISICGYADVFPDDKIKNPMWAKEGDKK